MLVRDWLHEGISWSKVTMDSPTDHYANPALYHEYFYWFDGKRQNIRTKVGWINEENQTVELITGTIRAADPESFDKLKWALNKATTVCCQIMTEKLELKKVHGATLFRPWVTAGDVIERLGEPQLL